MRPAAVRLFTVLATGALLCACGGGGGGSNSPMALPGVTAPGGVVPDAAARAVDTSTRSAPIALATTAPPPGCTYIVTVNPATQLDHSRTARRFTGGEHLNVDATGCDYGIYLGPASHHARITDSKLHGANRIAIIAEGADDVQIQDTATDGGPIAGIELIYNATGSVERSFITNTGSGVVIEFGSRGLVGESYITNTSFLGVNVLENAVATVEDVSIDNSMNVGGGVAVQLASTGKIRNVTAVGAGQPTAGNAPQYGFFFGYRTPHVEITDSRSIHNQHGFGAFCTAGIGSVDELTDEHNRARNSTLNDYLVVTDPALCPAPPPGF
jgi:Right handed beta helix region